MRAAKFIRISLIVLMATGLQNLLAGEPSGLSEKARDYFKSEIEGPLPGSARAYGIMRVSVGQMKRTPYCPMRTSRCGENPSCNHIKQVRTRVNLKVTDFLFKKGEGQLPGEFQDYLWLGKEKLKEGTTTVVSAYLQDTGECRISKVFNEK